MRRFRELDWLVLFLASWIAPLAFDAAIGLKYWSSLLFWLVPVNVLAPRFFAYTDAGGRGRRAFMLATASITVLGLMLDFVFGSAPAMVLFRSVANYVNWRAFAITTLYVILTSLVWEVLLALPRHWWGYKPAGMIGLWVHSFSTDAEWALPIESGVYGKVFGTQLYRIACTATGMAARVCYTPSAFLTAALPAFRIRSEFPRLSCVQSPSIFARARHQRYRIFQDAGVTHEHQALCRQFAVPDHRSRLADAV